MNVETLDISKYEAKEKLLSIRKTLKSEAMKRANIEVKKEYCS